VELRPIVGSDGLEHSIVPLDEVNDTPVSEAVVRSSNLPINKRPVFRSTRLTMQSLLPVPITVSISQCPSWRRSETS
jgi:hypothetical protein